MNMYSAPNKYYKSQRKVYDERARVSITNFSFCVGDRVYPFNIISRFGVSKITPNRKPGILTIALGASLALIGLFKGSYILGSVSLLLCISGLIAIFMASERYAVRILMGTEEMDALISREKSYAKGIVDSIKKELKRTSYGEREDEEEESNLF